MMSSSTYTQILHGAFTRAVVKRPSLAALSAEVLGRLRGRTYYEPELVDAIFQKWDRFPLTIEDAYGFLLVYCDMMIGQIRIARVHVGFRPGADKDVAGNQAKLLAGLQPQFGASFWGGAGDHDGDFAWHDHLHLGGYINVNGVLVDGPEVTVPAGNLALEVGYQEVGKTFSMLREQRGVARWPYDSEDIWVLYRVRNDDEVLVESMPTTCVRDEDGWPCARTRIVEAA